MRPGEPFGKVGHVGGEVGGDAQVGIAGANLVDILGAALLRHLEAAAEMLGQHGEPVGNHAGEDGRALTAAGDEDAEDAVLGERSEEHTSELQSLMRKSYDVFCSKKTNMTPT